MGYVQSDYKTAVNSINLGQPLVASEPASRIATELRQIAARFSQAVQSAPVTDARRGLIGSLFRKQPRRGEMEKPGAAPLAVEVPFTSSPEGAK
jgi:Flp pilus assembly CpaE family ATPase